MSSGELRINREKLQEWLKLATLSESQFAKEIGVDQGNFSKMLNKEIPTSKPVIEKVLARTLLPTDVILRFEQELANKE